VPYPAPYAEFRRSAVSDLDGQKQIGNIHVARGYWFWMTSRFSYRDAVGLSVEEALEETNGSGISLKITSGPQCTVPHE
jgi:hypothetical protein